MLLPDGRSHGSHGRSGAWRAVDECVDACRFAGRREPGAQQRSVPRKPWGGHRPTANGRTATLWRTRAWSRREGSRLAAASRSAGAPAHLVPPPSLQVVEGPAGRRAGGRRVLLRRPRRAAADAAASGGRAHACQRPHRCASVFMEAGELHCFLGGAALRRLRAPEPKRARQGRALVRVCSHLASCDARARRAPAGRAYNREPAIAIWELINEPRCALRRALRCGVCVVLA